MERQKLNHEYLIERGYVLNEHETDMLKDIEEKQYGIKDYAVYRDSSSQICIRREFNNRYGEKGYSVHVDNQDFQSIGWGVFLYMDEFEKFIELFKDDIQSE